jgi:hypothetical protein
MFGEIWLHSNFVGLPDKFNVRPFDHLQKPAKLHGIPSNPNILGAYATPNSSTLMSLFN